MTPPLWLIARREFRAYAATVSFWIALAVGPLAMALVLGLASIAGRPSPPVVVAVTAPEPAMARSVGAALEEAARIEKARMAVAYAAGAAAGTHVSVQRSADGSLFLRTQGDLPLSAAGRALVARTLERDALAAAAAGSAPVVRMASDAPAPRGPDAAGIARFAMVMMLWLTLTGSLGMLLQAVVRERSNRALESLLAAASPTEIVFGKLLGVGAVSVLVLVSWLGSSVALSPLAPASGGLAGAVMHGLADPLTLVRAAAIYVLGFAFYGLVTVAVGSIARDSAAAQNLSRPMFAVLLAAFFAALVAAGGGAQLSWLVFAPPFTPFMMLLQAPGAMALGEQALALAGLSAAILAAGAVAVRSLAITPPSMRWPLAPR